MRIREVVSSLFLVSSLATVCAADVPCVPIVAVPTVIVTPGSYCLTVDNLQYTLTSGAAIEIAVDDVVLDLGGRKLSGLGHALVATEGVKVRGGKSRVVVRNGNLYGFMYGVFLEGGNVDCEIADVRVWNMMLAGIYVGQSWAPYASQAGNVVRRCTVSRVGGTLYGWTVSVGIWVVADGTTITDNIVSAVTPPSAGGTTYGLIGGGNGDVQRNVVRGPSTTCVHLGTGDVYRDNTAHGCSSAYGGAGTDGGGNF